MFVTGDLAVDYVVSDVVLDRITRIPPTTLVPGGSCYNGSLAFARQGFSTHAFGSVGRDRAGDEVLDGLRQSQVRPLVARHPDRGTCVCHVIYLRSNPPKRVLFYEGRNANIYDPERLASALSEFRPQPTDVLVASLHIIDQVEGDLAHCKEFFDVLRSAKARLVLDLVPHAIYARWRLDEIAECVGTGFFLIVAEYQTLAGLTGLPATSNERLRCVEALSARLDPRYLSCRFGAGNIDAEDLVFRSARKFTFLRRDHATGYAKLEPHLRRGFGDALTADDLERVLENERSRGGRDATADDHRRVASEEL